MYPLASPVVVPVRSRRKVNFAAGRALLSYRRNQKCRTEHVLVTQIRDLRIIRKIHKQRSHERRTSLIGLVPERINVRHQLISQLQILLQNRLGLFAIRPNLVIFAAAVRAHDRQKRSVLKPPRIKFGIVIVSADILASIGRIEQWRMRGMMHWRQILPSANIVRPIRHA